MEKIRVGFALCGSFCTFSQAAQAVQDLVAEGYDVNPILSETSYSTDTRFGTAQSWVSRLELITGNRVIHSIVEAEPIGPGKLLDILVIAPCTGNTLAKLCYGIADTSVTMSAKSHLRNQRPVLIAVSTNDALGGAGKNVGNLLNYRNIYFVPMHQDDPEGKPRSVVADFTMIPQAAAAALEGRQLQPIYLPAGE